MTDRKLQLKGVHFRKKCSKRFKKPAIYEASAGHTDGELSCFDILNVLYNRILNVSRTIFPIHATIVMGEAKVTR